MKYLLYILFAFIVLSFNASLTFSKNYIIFPKDTVSINANMEDMETLTIQQNNISQDTLYFHWSKVSQQYPDNWELSICNNQICFANLIDSGGMNPIIPNDYGFLIIHCTPHVNYGTAVIKYAVWEEKSKDIKDTITFIINTQTEDVQAQNHESLNFWYYSNKIYLNNNQFETLEIFDLLGDLVFESKIKDMTEIEVPKLANSKYFIKLNDKNTSIFRSFIINN